MIIGSIEIKNIRNHSNTKLDFKEGITLLHGDVGAGKSSILYAIEFALFGIGSRFKKYKVSLLRAGEKVGWVKLNARIDGNEYVFFRKIESKSGGVSQGECYIIEERVKTSYKAEEMRKRVLDILKFREPKKSTSSSYIYEYAIFTPQEEMRSILEKTPKERLESLRRAFGVLDYINAKESATLLSKLFRDQIKTLRIFIERLKEKEREMRAREEDLKRDEDKREKEDGEMGVLNSKLLRIEKELRRKKEEKEKEESLEGEKTL
jgi:ATPase involved in DNA repair